MSQVKSCDCETCKLKIDLYEKDKTNGIRENVSGAFIFARKLCDIVFLRAAGALKKVHAKLFLIFSLAELFSLIQRKRFASIPVP